MILIGGCLIMLMFLFRIGLVLVPVLVAPFYLVYLMATNLDNPLIILFLPMIWAFWSAWRS